VLCLVLAVVAVPVVLDLTACSAAEKRVLAFYQQALASRGWTVQPPQANAEGRELRSGVLTARRGDDTDTVLHESRRPSGAVAPMWPCMSPGIRTTAL
jgi:hypothetical protein